MTGTPTDRTDDGVAGRDPTGGLAARYFWSGHENPGSVWTLLAAYPTLVVALYRRDRRLLAATLLFVAANPLLFPSPDDDGAWATRVVRGERVWLHRSPWSSPADLLFVAVATPVNLYALRSALRRRRVGTVVGTAASLALSLLFFRRMARLYDAASDVERDAAGVTS